MDDSYSVFLGLDVGKGDHHAVGLDPSGERLHDATLPNSEPKLREVFDRLAARGRVLVVVDQPATIGALPDTVARTCGHKAAYLPGLPMRRIADLYPGNAKTDARDAYVIADAARTLPRALRRVDVGDEALAELDEQIDVAAGQIFAAGHRAEDPHVAHAQHPRRFVAGDGWLRGAGSARELSLGEAHLRRQPARHTLV